MDQHEGYSSTDSSYQEATDSSCQEGDLSMRKKHIMMSLRWLRLLVLVGVCFSMLLFCLNQWVAEVHDVDMQIINYMGRLRKLTQNLGMVLVLQTTQNLTLDQVSQYYVTPSKDSCTTIESISGELLSNPNGNLKEGAPEIIDDNVKMLVHDWTTQAYSLCSLRFKQEKAGEITEVINRVNRITNDMDSIVDVATDAADGRTLVIKVLSALRAVVGIFIAVVTAMLTHKIYSLIALEFDALRAMQAGQLSLLGACMDAVSVVSAVEPFHVLQSTSKFDDLCGGAMQNGSIRELAANDDERRKLENALKASLATAAEANTGHEKSAGILTFLRNLWHVQVQQIPKGIIPIAQKINSKWQFQEQVADVELIISRTATERSLLLGVTILGRAMPQGSNNTEMSTLSRELPPESAMQMAGLREGGFVQTPLESMAFALLETVKCWVLGPDARSVYDAIRQAIEVLKSRHRERDLTFLRGWQCSRCKCCSDSCDEQCNTCGHPQFELAGEASPDMQRDVHHL